MKDEIVLLRLIQQKQQENISFKTTLEELSTELKISKSEVERILRKFTSLNYCTSVFESGEGTVLILPITKKGLDFIK